MLRRLAQKQGVESTAMAIRLANGAIDEHYRDAVNRLVDQA
jgi:hypothetical protein